MWTTFDFKSHFAFCLSLFMVFDGTLLNLTLMMFSQSTHLLMYLSWDTLATFLLRYLTVTPIVLLFSIYFFWCMLGFPLEWLFFHWEMPVMFSQFPLSFLQTQKGMLLFITQFKTILVHWLEWFDNHWRDVPWEDVFRLSAFAAGINFFQWVQVGIDV